MSSATPLSADPAHRWVASKLQFAPNRGVLTELALRLAQCVPAAELERAFAIEMHRDGYFQKELPL